MDKKQVFSNMKLYLFDMDGTLYLGDRLYPFTIELLQKIRAVGAACLVAIWVLLTGFAWFGPRTDISEAERRPLDQMPELSGKTRQR